MRTRRREAVRRGSDDGAVMGARQCLDGAQGEHEAVPQGAALAHPLGACILQGAAEDAVSRGSGGGMACKSLSLLSSVSLTSSSLRASAVLSACDTATAQGLLSRAHRCSPPSCIPGHAVQCSANPTCIADSSCDGGTTGSLMRSTCHTRALNAPPMAAIRAYPRIAHLQRACCHLLPRDRDRLQEAARGGSPGL